MKKNYKLHLLLDKNLAEMLKKQSEEMGVPLSEICRQRLKEQTKLDRIEIMLERISEKLKN